MSLAQLQHSLLQQLRRRRLSLAQLLHSLQQLRRRRPKDASQLSAQLRSRAEEKEASDASSTKPQHRSS
jgi:hypothetical protein